MKIAYMYNVSVVVDDVCEAESDGGVDHEGMEESISEAVSLVLKEKGRGILIPDYSRVVAIGTQFETDFAVQ